MSETKWRNIALKLINEGGGSGNNSGGSTTINNQDKTITANGVYTADSGYTGLGTVEVNVPIPDGYIVPEGTMTITENGTYEVAAYSEVVVDVPSSGGEGGSSLKKLLDATKSCQRLFYQSTLTSVEGLISFDDTSNVTDMMDMFYECKKLTAAPLLDTSNVTTMWDMFYYCMCFTTIPPYDTSNVTNMGQMFYYCTALETVPLFDTNKVTNMSQMFSNCVKLTVIPPFNTSSLTGSIYGIFDNCRAITIVPQLDFRNITAADRAFRNCQGLTTCLIRNIPVTLQVGSGTSYGHLLTMESLLNLLNETRYYTDGKTRTLTVGTANLAKFTGEYECVKLTGEIVDVDDQPCEKVNGCKVRCTWCASTDEGAMTIAEYMQMKGWQIA